MKTTKRENLTRRQILCLAGAAAGLGFLSGRTALAKGPNIEIYKSPECGCCGLWSTYLRESGFEVKIVEIDNIDSIKEKARVPANLETCHTAFLGGYVIEGHVPIAAIDKLLIEQPNVVGIAVPGMPLGSPGMPSKEKEPFDVVAFAADGSQTRFMSFR